MTHRGVHPCYADAEPSDDLEVSGVEQAFAVLSNPALHAFFEIGKLGPFLHSRRLRCWLDREVRERLVAPRGLWCDARQGLYSEINEISEDPFGSEVLWFIMLTEGNLDL